MRSQFHPSSCTTSSKSKSNENLTINAHKLQEQDLQQGRNQIIYQNTQNHHTNRENRRNNNNNHHHHRKNNNRSLQFGRKSENSGGQYLSQTKSESNFNDHENSKSLNLQSPMKRDEKAMSRNEFNSNFTPQPQPFYAGNQSSSTNSVSSSSDRSLENFFCYSTDMIKQNAFIFNGQCINPEQLNFNGHHQYYAQQNLGHKRPMQINNDYYLKRLYNYNSCSEQPPNLRCQPKYNVLSEQIWDKYVMFRQSNSIYYRKINIWCELYDLLKKFPLFQHRGFQNWSLHLVGSTISGFGIDSSDIDICLALKSAPHFDARSEAVGTLNEIKKFLIDYGCSFRSFYLINAKVPILRFRDSTNTIEIDLNYNNCIGVRNTHLLNCYAQLDWRLRPLVIMVKLWAKHHNLNDARNGTISSYSLVLMVIHFLQSAVKPTVLPCLHKTNPDKFNMLHDITTIDILEQLNVDWKPDNKRPLGELFLRFLDYYSNFDYTKVISVRTGGTLMVEQCKIVKSPKNDPNHWQTLCIEEPFDLTNTARSTYDWEIFAGIKNAFFQSWRRLNDTKNLDVLFQEPLFIKPIVQQQHFLNHLNSQGLHQQMNFLSNDSSGDSNITSMHFSNPIPPVLTNQNVTNSPAEFSL